jgi:hypothetical protein
MATDYPRPPERATAGWSGTDWGRLVGCDHGARDDLFTVFTVGPRRHAEADTGSLGNRDEELCVHGSSARAVLVGGILSAVTGSGAVMRFPPRVTG